MQDKHVVTVEFNSITLRSFCPACQSDGSVHESTFIRSKISVNWQTFPDFNENFCAFQVAVAGVTSAKVAGSGGMSGWNSAPNTQYHIQTDEGPERYFRYQTLSGQYRKEKRLQDGTVVGSYGWIDPNGYLRLRDYVADNAGYRVVRTKMLFVGKDAPISDAVAKSKNVPSQGGTSVNTLQVSTTAAPPVTTTANPVTNPAYISPVGSYPYPQPEISSNSLLYPSSTAAPFYANDPSNSLIPRANIYTNPYVLGSNEQYRSIPANRRTYDIPAYDQSYQQNYVSSSNNVQRYQSPYSQQQLPLYDGISTTNNGFRYYLPRQYHEEENSGGDRRTGSFGYIDPFGIRRVVYYNTSPGSGFVHRKNNRYVGFNATPYDPRYWR